MSENNRTAVVVYMIGCVVLLLIGMLPSVPIGYYTFLRYALFFAFMMLAFVALDAGRLPWAIGFAALMILFNPFIKIYLGREGWLIADIIAIPYVVIASLVMRGKKPDRD